MIMKILANIMVEQEEEFEFVIHPRNKNKSHTTEKKHYIFHTACFSQSEEMNRTRWTAGHLEVCIYIEVDDNNNK